MTDDQLYVYLERLGIAEDLGMDTGPGSFADRIAREEAEQCQPQK